MNYFQAESKRSGDEFEQQVLNDLVMRGAKLIHKNVVLKDIGCEVDFHALYDSSSEWVEAKGGKDDSGKRPGAKRTDNVKKAIANGSLIKAKYPHKYYVVYFSAKPIPGSSSDNMIKTALRYNLIDEVRYVTSNTKINLQLDLFDGAISERKK